MYFQTVTVFSVLRRGIAILMPRGFGTPVAIEGRRTIVPPFRVHGCTGRTAGSGSMDVTPFSGAMECPIGSVDLPTLGKRIARAAAMASAVHVGEFGARPGRTDVTRDNARIPESRDPLSRE